ncbi:MAG: thioredoxin-disulfide reductase [Clostridium sp.]
MNKEIKSIDLVIIGGGPAGLTSAIYSARANVESILLEDKILGGQVRTSYSIENYPGYKNIQGSELADLMQQQAEELGANIDEFDIIENVRIVNGEKIVETESYIYKTKTIIIATGATPRPLPIPREKEFSGKGIHYCAVCDGAMYTDKVVAVIGGGNSALEEAVFLSRFAKKVIMIRRYDYFNGEKTMLEEVMENSKIEILYNEDLVDVYGDMFVEGAVIKNTLNGEERNIELDAIFGYIGTIPKTDQFKEILTLSKQGYIVTDELMRTNVEGIYAAGDVREKVYRQITTAVADGTIAALEAEKYITKK